MKKLVEHFRKRLGHATNGALPEDPVDLDAEIAAIARAETDRDVGLGKRIHQFRYRELDLRLDRDVLGLYRVTVHEGTERIYSFTVVCPPGDYDALRDGYATITRFLDSNRRLADLPNDDRLKGHFYGP